MGHRNINNHWQAAFAACLLGTCLLPSLTANATIDCLPDRIVPIPDVTLPLAGTRAGPALVFKTESIELHMRQADLNEALREAEGPAYYPRTALSRALLKLPPFTQDVTVAQLLEQIGPAKPDHPMETRSEQWREYRRENKELKFWMEIVISKLLESGRAAAKDPKTEASKATVLRTKAATTCYAPVTYRTMDGKVFLEMKDQLL